MINRMNLILAMLLAVVSAVAVFVGVDYSRPNFEVLPDMKYSPAWSAFSANPNFPNGRTLQAPVPGTISRGHMPLHYAATKEDAIRAGEELHNPYVLTVAAARLPADDKAAERRKVSIQRGGDVFRAFCVSCHGPAGAGDGPVPQRGFPPPPSMLTGKSGQMKDGQLFHILTFGQASMSPFVAQLSPERRWDVINYVRELQRPVSQNTPQAAMIGDPSHVDRESTDQTKRGF